MNLIDAVKSGKRFKRKGGEWHLPNASYSYAPVEILATDWEIEERKIEITESEFKKITDKTLALTLSEYNLLKEALFDK